MICKFLSVLIACVCKVTAPPQPNVTINLLLMIFAMDAGVYCCVCCWLYLGHGPNLINNNCALIFISSKGDLFIVGYNPPLPHPQRLK